MPTGLKPRSLTSWTGLVPSGQALLGGGDVHLSKTTYSDLFLVQAPRLLYKVRLYQRGPHVIPTVRTAARYSFIMVQQKRRTRQLLGST